MWRPAAGGSQSLASGGPVPRPPGTMTWLRGARCTDPEEMPEKEARDPAENRHGGAPRGARPDRKGRRAPRRVPGPLRYCGPAGCLARSVIAGLPGAAAPGAFVGAPPTPHRGRMKWRIANREKEKEKEKREERDYS